jgi:anthranilate/para-aminobenzoate synthase component I
MQGDARHYAAAILKRLQQRHLKNAFCCYGTREKVLLGIGRAASLKLAETATLDTVWTGINSFIESNSSDYIFGFIGFDPANQLRNKIEDYRQKIDLFVPGTVIECRNSGCRLLKGSLVDDSIDIDSISEWPELDDTVTGNADPLAVDELDHSELRSRYAESAACFIDEIRSGTLERATLARKINVTHEFDLARTFLSDQSWHQHSRSFYFSNERISFAGQCPELLAEGNTRSFTTHKLSGTWSKDDKTPIEELASRFLSDQRIISEHQSAIVAIEKSLSDIGKVACTKFRVMELPTLLHGWSQFITCPKDGVTVARCLRSVFPFGVNPVTRGFKLLAEHEDFCRGPYYGLTGCIQPDGEFSFTQVLRSAFVDNEGSYLMAGAAITSHSTPALEAEETRTKLYGVKVFGRADS